MTLPSNKTKLVATIGPASDSQKLMEKMLLAGMNCARLNFSHGHFAYYDRVIADLRAASASTGRSLAILADLPGPKIRIGQLAEEPISLVSGDPFTLTLDEVLGDNRLVSVMFPPLLKAVKPGDRLFLNDGLIELSVKDISSRNINCNVLVGGELRSRKGVNLPDIDLGISAFTPRDRECLEFALQHGVDAIGQSFVESPEDIATVRRAAEELGYYPLVVAKIERSRALLNIDAIIRAADAIMIARGDLGVETPIEEIAVLQKRLIQKANRMGKPVITATQMLESMTSNPRPTRAESTDVANAILDGTDCVMLSEESATGAYPVESVAMLARIAASVEPSISSNIVKRRLKLDAHQAIASLRDLIALSVETTVASASPAAVIVPTRSGDTARSIARFRLPLWITAVSTQESTCRKLQFSYGVYPVCKDDHPEDWKFFAKEWLTGNGLQGELVVLTEGPSSKHPEANNRMEIIDLSSVYV